MLFVRLAIAIASAAGCGRRASDAEYADLRYTSSPWCELRYCGCPRTRDLQRLVVQARPPGPEALTIEDLSEAPDLAPLASLPSLRSLAVYKIEPARLSLLASLPRLESLTVQIATAGREVSLAPLSRLTRLRVVRVGGLSERCDLEPLAELRELEEIVVDCRGAIDLTPLVVLPKLRTLRVMHAKIANRDPVAALAASLAVLDLGEGEQAGTPICEIEPDKCPGLDACERRRRGEREGRSDESVITAPRR